MSWYWHAPGRDFIITIEMKKGTILRDDYVSFHPTSSNDSTFVVLREIKRNWNENLYVEECVHHKILEL